MRTIRKVTGNITRSSTKEVISFSREKPSINSINETSRTYENAPTQVKSAAGKILIKIDILTAYLLVLVYLINIVKIYL